MIMSLWGDFHLNIICFLYKKKKFLATTGAQKEGWPAGLKPEFFFGLAAPVQLSVEICKQKLKTEYILDII